MLPDIDVLAARSPSLRGALLAAKAAGYSHLRTLGDLGYEGESGTITVALKKPKDGRLTLVQQRPTHVPRPVSWRRSARRPLT